MVYPKTMWTRSEGPQRVSAQARAQEEGDHDDDVVHELRERMLDTRLL